MQTKILNYRVIISPDFQTGNNKAGYTSFSPKLGIGDDGDTIDESLINIKKAIESYVKSLIEDNLPVPIDNPNQDIVTTTQINVPTSLQTA